MNSTILLLERCFPFSAIHSSFFPISFLYFSLFCSRHCFKCRDLRIFSLPGDEQVLQWKVLALIKINPCGFDSHKQCIVCAASLKDRKLLRSDFNYLVSYSDGVSWLTILLRGSHTEKFFRALCIPNSKVKQRTEREKILAVNPRTDAGSLVGHRQIISPVTFPTSNAEINYFLASLEGWET